MRLDDWRVPTLGTPWFENQGWRRTITITITTTTTIIITTTITIEDDSRGTAATTFFGVNFWD